MFMKNEKKKMRPWFAVGIGALTVYGAYSMVACIKNTCCKKVEMLTNVIKNSKNKKKDCSEDMECDFET